MGFFSSLAIRGTVRATRFPVLGVDKRDVRSGATATQRHHTQEGGYRAAVHAYCYVVPEEYNLHKLRLLC